MNKQWYAIPKCNVLLKKTLNGYLSQIESRFSGFSIVVCIQQVFIKFSRHWKEKERNGHHQKNTPRNHYNYLVRKSNRVMMIIKRKPSLHPDQHANVE
jgi:hypothetical protein